MAALAALIYFLQGSLGIAGISLLLYLRHLGWSIPKITGVMSLGAVPWIFKIFYGLISDCFPLAGYRRKSYLVLCSMAASAGWLLLAREPDSQSNIFFALLVTNAAFAATDVIADALIVEHSTAVSSPIYQSIAWGSRSLGAIVSGIAGGWFAAHWAPARVFLLTAALPIAIGGAALLVHEHRWEKLPFKTLLDPFVRGARLIMTSNLRWLTILFLIIAIPSAFGLPFFYYMREHLKFKETFLGLLGSIAWMGAMFGSLLYLKWLKGLPPKFMMRAVLCLNAVNILLFLLIRDPRGALVVMAMAGLFGCLAVLPMVSAAAVLTRHSGIEAAMFALFMSIYSMGQILFGFLGGKIYPYTGLAPLVLVSATAAVSGIYFVNRLSFSKKF